MAFGVKYFISFGSVTSCYYDILIDICMLPELISEKDDGYPPLLREMSSPPTKLYILGDNHVLSGGGIAIVGTRKASPRGREVAKKFAIDIAGAGFVVVSGLAEGIDTAAHEGAIEAGGKTIAVLGTAIDSVYPKENKDLANRIIEGWGAVISEYGPSEGTSKESFVLRNRIISGLSLAVVVIEAPETSGALATARFAGEQGRGVFVVPGSIDDPNYVGSHALIRDGAILVTSVEEVLSEI